MLVHLHPTKQEARVQVEVHATQRVQLEVTIDRANLVFRQPERLSTFGCRFRHGPTHCNILLVKVVPGDFPRCTVIESLMSVRVDSVKTHL